MTRKVLPIALLLIATLSFTGEAWSGIVGRWKVAGTFIGKATVPIQGEIKLTQPVKDNFVFKQDHTFKMTDIKGTWRKKLDKFKVTLNTDQLEADIEGVLGNLGYNVQVAIQSYSFIISPQEDPNKIKGTIKVTIDAEYLAWTIPMKVSINFKGNKILRTTQTVQSDMVEDMDTAAENATMMGAIIQSLKNQLP